MKKLIDKFSGWREAVQKKEGARGKEGRNKGRRQEERDGFRGEKKSVSRLKEFIIFRNMAGLQCHTIKNENHHHSLN